MLALPDEQLLGLDRTAAARYEGFDAAAARRRIAGSGLTAVCRCGPGYPERLRELPDPPAVLHVAGSLAALPDGEAVAIVGARRATPYGLEVSRSLGRGLTAAGLPVVSGMALGIDSAAHAGALEPARRGRRPSPCWPVARRRRIPARMRGLHARLIAAGAVVSEMPPGFTAHRWCFPARNRIIAALSTITVVVEAATRSRVADHRRPGDRPRPGDRGRARTGDVALLGGHERAAARRGGGHPGRAGRARPRVRLRRAAGSRPRR